MNPKEIEELIDRFYEGMTTPVEEATLREYFSRGEVPPHLAVHSALFGYFRKEAKAGIPDPEFEEKLLGALEEKPALRLFSGKKQFLYLAGLAAAFLLLAGLFFTFRNDFLLKAPSDQARIEQQYREAQRMLVLLSANLNTGIDQARKIGTFQKGIDQMNQFSLFYQYQPLIINPGSENRP